MPDDHETSLEIRAAEFTTSDIGDAPMLPELLDQFPPEQEIATVTADGAFGTRKCHDAIAARGAAATSGIHLNQWRSCPPPASQECQAVETRHPGGHRTQRYPAQIKARWSNHLAAMEPLSPQKSGRDVSRIRKQSPGLFSRRSDALRQALGPAPVRTRLRPSGRRVPRARRRAKRLHSHPHTHHRRRRITPSGERGAPVLTRFVQKGQQER